MREKRDDSLDHTSLDGEPGGTLFHSTFLLSHLPQTKMIDLAYPQIPYPFPYAHSKLVGSKPLGKEELILRSKAPFLSLTKDHSWTLGRLSLVDRVGQKGSPRKDGKRCREKRVPFKTKPSVRFSPILFSLLTPYLPSLPSFRYSTLLPLFIP